MKPVRFISKSLLLLLCLFLALSNSVFALRVMNPIDAGMEEELAQKLGYPIPRSLAAGMEEPWSITSVKTLRGLAEFIVERYSLGTLTDHSLMQAHVKYEELVGMNQPSYELAEEDVFQILISLIEELEDRQGIAGAVSEWFPIAFRVRDISTQLYKVAMGAQPLEGFDAGQADAALVTGTPQRAQRARLAITQHWLKSALVLHRGYFEQGIPLDQEEIESFRQTYRRYIQELADAVPSLDRMTTPSWSAFDRNDWATLRRFFDDQSREIVSLQTYLARRDAVLGERGFAVTEQNRSVFKADLQELLEWVQVSGMPIMISPPRVPVG